MNQEGVQKNLKELENLVEARFPEKYIFKTKPFYVEERENVGLSLFVKQNFFGNQRLMTVDIAYEPSDYQYNLIFCDKEDLREVAVGYFNQHNLPFG